MHAAFALLQFLFYFNIFSVSFELSNVFRAPGFSLIVCVKSLVLDSLLFAQLLFLRTFARFASLFYLVLCISMAGDPHLKVSMRKVKSKRRCAWNKKSTTSLRTTLPTSAAPQVVLLLVDVAEPTTSATPQGTSPPVEVWTKPVH